jgi:hypothetical protein
MRALLISVLAATLVGCTCLPASDPNAAHIDSKPVAFKADAQNAKLTIAANTHTPPSTRFGKKTNSVAKRAKHTIAGKMEPLPSAQLNDEANPVTEKAKAAIAAIMENPASAEFGETKRAVKSLLGEPLETICGYVKGKNASGKDTGEMPFLYIINRDEAYLVDGSNLTAETVYRTLCNEEGAAGRERHYPPAR